MISCKNINKKYGQVQVLKDVSLDLPTAKVICITGPSGAGKSTLLHILGTLDKADSGQVLYNGQDITHFKDKELAKFRNQNIGFVFQFHHLLPEFTAFENICIPGYLGNRPVEEVQERALYLLEILGMSHRSHHRPSELSGGEQQRVSVARALINSPKIVLADEPSGNLDTTRANELHQIFFDLKTTLNQTFVIVTHNEYLAAQADVVFKMQDGQISF
ncbi:MAG TPA: ABC transporter ATP-binding protein [Chitinophagales bacterium]|nr:ABC transporter ATP-binding protein [Chitinophagales bacterium]